MLHKANRLRLISSWLAAVLCLVALCACRQANHSSNKAPKEPSMATIENEEFTWQLDISSYGIDQGNADVGTLEYGNWLKDAHGKDVMRFYGGTGGWGKGATPMGGNPLKSRLPKTLHLTYYDYQEDRFYELETELPQKKLYKLFTQKRVSISLDGAPLVPRFDRIAIGIAPNGYIMLWAGSMDGEYQVELAGPLQAVPMQGMTVQRHNSACASDFRLYADRWKHLANGVLLEPATIAKLQTGWLPDNSYYRNQRIKYPWRFHMSGNARLVEFQETLENQENYRYGPWEMAQYQNVGAMRGVPSTGTFWFNDRTGKRHSIFLGFWSKERVASEPDIAAVFAAFEQIFPKRELSQNDHLPNEEEMATIDIHVSDDLKTYTATLVKGQQAISISIGRTQFFDLEPYAYFPSNDSPAPEERKRYLNGPDS